MKILYVIGSLEAGGAEKQLLILVRHLTNHGIECGVVTLEGKGKLTPFFVKCGVKVFEFGLKKKELYNHPWKIILFVFFLIRIIRKYKPDILHSLLPLISMLSSMAGKICNVSIVITSKRGLSTHQKRILILKYCDIIADILSDKIIANSFAVKADTLKYSPVSDSKIDVICNGVELPKSLPSFKDKASLRKSLGIPIGYKVITYVANLIPYKGHKDLIDAIYLLKDKYPDLILLLVGEDRGIGDQLRIQCSSLGIKEKVCFLGYRDDVWEILMSSDIYVHASHEEGCSNAILEAMAVGLPVIATDVGGNSEAVTDGVDGILVPPNSPLMLSLAVSKMLESPEKAQAMGERAKINVLMKFSLEKMVGEYLSLYTKLLERSRAG